MRSNIVSLAALAVLCWPLEAIALGSDCWDGIDNDGDGYVDFADPGCTSGVDPLETDPNLPCDDGIDNDGDGLIDSGRDLDGDLYPDNPTKDPGCQAPTSPREDPECNDGRDNENDLNENACAEGCVIPAGDGFIDYPEDLGCVAPYDPKETQQGLPCDDGADNDGDRSVDFAGGPNPLGGNSGADWLPADVGCSSPWADLDERINGGVCDNGLDDDGDGLIDTADPGCAGLEDTDEVTHAVCDDGIDNDGDGLVDWLDDPDCAGDAFGAHEAPHFPPIQGVASSGPGGRAALALLIAGAGGFVVWRRGGRALGVLLPLLLLVGSEPAEARTLSSAGVLMAHATNELLSAPLAYVDEANGDRSWLGDRWIRWPALPFTGTARMIGRIGAWAWTGFAMVPLEVFTYRFQEGVGMIAPLHPDPHWTVVSESALRPTCGWPWADRAPRCVPR